MPLSTTEVVDTFRRGDFGALVGELESDWLECKRFPYPDQEASRFELAKDITGLANADGGILLLGFTTEQDSVHRADKIAAITPFMRARFNEVQFRQWVHNWTYPPIDNLEVTVADVGPDQAVVMVQVPAADAATRPIIVKKILNAGDRATDIAIAICERRQAGVKRLGFERIHALLRDGLRFNDEIRNEFDGLRAQINQLLDQAPPAAEGFNAFARRYPACRDIAELGAGLVDTPAMVLSCFPRERIEIREFFEARTAPAVQLLENPPRIRPGGFVSRPDRSRIINGDMRRSETNEYSVLDAYRDGTLVYAVRGDAQGLLWASRGRPTINPVFLLESTHVFMLLAKELLVPRGVTVGSFRLELRRMFQTDPEGRPLNPQAIPVIEGRPLPHPDAVAMHDLPFEHAAVERAAFELCVQLYHLVGLEDDRVPFSIPSGELGRVVNIQGIQAV